MRSAGMLTPLGTRVRCTPSSPGRTSRLLNPFRALQQPAGSNTSRGVLSLLATVPEDQLPEAFGRLSQQAFGREGGDVEKDTAKGRVVAFIWIWRADHANCRKGDASEGGLPGDAPVVPTSRELQGGGGETGHHPLQGAAGGGVGDHPLQGRLCAFLQQPLEEQLL